MSKDLSIFHLANRADIEEVQRLGPRTSVRFMHASRSVKVTTVVDGVSVESTETVTDAADPARVIYPVQELPEGATTADVTPVDAATLVVEVEGVALRQYSGDIYDGLGELITPPLGQYLFLPAAGLLGEDQIKMAEAPISRFRLVYSTTEEAKYVVFNVIGTGFQYVTSVLLGGEETNTFSVKSDRLLEVEALVAAAGSVVVENISALVELEESPAPTDIIFDISTRAKRASGSKLLQQRFLTLLMSPDGADLLNLIPKGMNVTPSLRTVILNRVGLAVGLTRAKIQRDTPSDAPANEILANAFVEGVSVNTNTGAVSAQVKLRTLSGQNLSFPVGI